MANHFCQKEKASSSHFTAYGAYGVFYRRLCTVKSIFREQQQKQRILLPHSPFSRAATRFAVGTHSLVLHIYFLILLFFWSFFEGILLLKFSMTFLYTFQRNSSSTPALYIPTSKNKDENSFEHRLLEGACNVYSQSHAVLAEEYFNLMLHAGIIQHRVSSIELDSAILCDF